MTNRQDNMTDRQDKMTCREGQCDRPLPEITTVALMQALKMRLELSLLPGKNIKCIYANAR